MTDIADRPRSFLVRVASAERIALAIDFFRFGCVGLCGFVFDTATVYATRYSLGLYGAGIVAYVVAATVTWLLNRIWTFRGRGAGPAHLQWGLFLAVNLVGFVLNRGTYVAMIATMPVAAANPVIAIFAGMLAGMFANFALARSVVFRG